MPYLQPRTDHVTLNASGAGSVTFEIDNTDPKWVIDSVHVETNQAATATPVPQARTDVNGVPHGGTYSGNFDQATGRAILFAGDVLTVTWTGGIPGTVATAVIWPVTDA